jgi:uncharacterized membrane protein
MIASGIVLIVVGLALVIAGCSHNVVAPVPGSANQFDSDTYLTLVTAKAAIDSAKQELANGAFTSATVAANVRTAINAAVTAYNASDITYQAYHTAALAGNVTPAQQAAVSSSLSTLNTTVGNITTAKGSN